MMTDREKVVNGLKLLAHWPDALIFTDKEKWIKPCCEMAIGLLKEQNNCENCAIAIEDRQPIVRCKDCKWWHESETHKGYGDCGQANGITLKPSNWFCDDGEKW